ncbi:MAG: serine/threonine-protein kinase [Tepidisphaeraceae bacterium]
MAKAGDRISEYVLEEPLGSGAFGEVWRGRHHVWHAQQVAVKLPHDSEYIRQLQREGLAVQGLEHPNIVRAIGFDPYADPPYLISELVPGESLRAQLKRGPLPVDRTIKVIREVLAGLAFAHGRGIVHRDIKPENILLDRVTETDFGPAKLADFGFGQQVQAGTSIVYSMSIDGPAAQRVAGTLDYMAPEQRAGALVDGRADLYAVGVVLFELLTGEKPAGTEVPGDLNPAVPAYLNDVFRRAYTRLERRFPTADAFAAALAPALPPRRGPPALPPTRRACPRCHRQVSSDDQFCMYCGVQLIPIIRRCSHCGSYPGPHDEHCMRCGKPLAGLKPVRA